MAPARTRKRRSDQSVVVDPIAESSASEDIKNQHDLPVRSKDSDSGRSAEPVSVPAKGTMMVFGDDDDEAAAPAPAVSSKPVVQVPEEEEEEEDSDDEAPEAVSTAKVASDVKKSTQAAQKAAQEEAATQKRKRRERDALFKQQAEERKKLKEESRAAEDTLAREAESGEVSIQRKRAARGPNLLPDKYLADSSSEDEESVDYDSTVARPRKRRVATVERNLARQDRGPKDERVGSTVYRVTKKADERMAPKLRKHARSSKDLLLKRNRSVAKPRSGFFVK
ncbi:hypothetical protein NM208_g8289 [Fusarium decemcellulare]|uniref:Uncharacterized protein n=1 Tax=Fusarium decemcellulare TaxID=57161 RepID=A0ACC1S5Y5_9HYPO|nr:hypothetical protein NM208_g8289 [Fusarium decemcellulare]